MWTVASVDVEPEVTLTCWRILETDTGNRYFVEYDNDFTWRVSLVIVVFDCNNVRGDICSGRIISAKLIAAKSW